LYKRSLTGLNLLIFISIFILPALIFITAYDIASVASSIKIANPTQTLTGSKITVSTVLTIRNTGPFEINAGITPSIRSNQGTWIGATGPKLTIPADSQVKNIPVAVEIDIGTVTEDDAKRLAFNPENFTIEISANVGMTPIISLGAEASAQATWLPPLHNLTIGMPVVRAASPTQIKIEVPLSFENQSPFFPVNGAGIIRLFDPTDQFGEGTIKISAQPGTKWSESTLITIAPPTDVKDLLLNDATLKYRGDLELTLTDYPVVMKALSQSFELDWGAPIRNPQVQTSSTSVNSTHTRIKGTMSFLNNNHFLTLDGAFTPKLVNGAGDTWIGKTQQVHVAPGSAGSLNLEVVVPNNQLPVSGLRLVLGIETTSGSFDLEVGSLG
jgi:hypothetical protein